MDLLKSWLGAISINGNNINKTSNSKYEAVETKVFKASGKWYCEANINFLPENSYLALGVHSNNTTNSSYIYGYSSTEFTYDYLGNKMNSYKRETILPSIQKGDVVGIYLDLDNYKLYFSHSNQKNPILAYELPKNVQYRVGVKAYNQFDITMNFGESSFKIFENEEMYRALDDSRIASSFIRVKRNENIYKNIYINKNYKIPYKISNIQDKREQLQYSNILQMLEGKMFSIPISEVKKYGKFKIKSLVLD